MNNKRYKLNINLTKKIYKNIKDMERNEICTQIRS